jgi:hypothetical protein
VGSSRTAHLGRTSPYLDRAGLAEAMVATGENAAAATATATFNEMSGVPEVRIGALFPMFRTQVYRTESPPPLHITLASPLIRKLRMTGTLADAAG